MDWIQGQLQLIAQQGYGSVAFAFLIILLLETILSVDNATALASIINKQLKTQKERDKALTYGIIGAYFFRGISLFFVSYMLENPTIGVFIKAVGGLYLLRLAYSHFTPKVDSIEEGDTGWIDSLTTKIGMSAFVSTVIAVEILDLSLSIDNILACISMSKIVLVVIIAVFVGILLMRFVTKFFSRLIVKYPKLENSAFIVIALLGLKLVAGAAADYFPVLLPLKTLLENHYFDFGFSSCTILIFLYPIINGK